MEKKVEPVTVKFSADQYEFVCAIADLDGGSVSDYIRSLVNDDIVRRRHQFDALNRIFGKGAPSDQGNKDFLR